MTYRHGLATIIRVIPFLALSLCFVHNFQAQAVKTVQVQAHRPAVTRRMTRQQRLLIRHNEAGALKSLQTLFSAEVTYQSTTGNGDYGTLEELRKEGLLDYVLAQGHRYGYLFRIRREKRSSESQSLLEIVAIPRTYRRTGLRSFWLDETGAIHAADKNGAEASIADPLFEIDP